MIQHWSADMQDSKKPGPPQKVRRRLQGNPQQGPPVYRNSHTDCFGKSIVQRFFSPETTPSPSASRSLKSFFSRSRCAAPCIAENSACRTRDLCSAFSTCIQGSFLLQPSLWPLGSHNQTGARKVRTNGHQDGYHALLPPGSLIQGHPLWTQNNIEGPQQLDKAMLFKLPPASG